MEDAALIRMMGFPVLEALPSRTVPYEQVDPFILVHEGRMRLSEVGKVDTKHPHRGFDNLWYVIEGSASTGHSTGPDGAIERARLSEGALLALRTGRGAWHAEGIGEDEIERGPRRHRVPRRAVLGEPRPEGQAGRTERAGPAARRDPDAARGRRDRSDAGRRGLPRAARDAGAHPRRRAPDGGQVTIPVPPEFQGFAYLLEGEGTFGANGRRAKPPQLVVLGPGEEFTVTDAVPGTRYLLMAGKPYGEVPVFNGPYVD